MSTRTAIRPHAVVTNGDMSASITSQATILQSVSQVTYTVTWTGSTPVGTLAAQATSSEQVGPDGTIPSTATWSSLPLMIDASSVAKTIAISGNTGDCTIAIHEKPGYAVRLVYTRSSGTGTMQAKIEGGVK